MAEIVRVGTEHLDEVVSFLTREQSHPERNIPALGEDAQGIAAELDEFESGWATAAHGVRAEDGTLVGVAFAEWDLELGRLWLHGPWVAGDNEQWGMWAGELLDAVLGATPAEIRHIVMSGTIENVRLGEFAQTHGYARSEPNYVLALALNDAQATAPDGDVRDAAAEDVAWIAHLHDAEFPATYASPQQLVDGKYVCLVLPGGYAAGRITPEGEGYIDFLAVQAAARGAGVGRRLVLALVARLQADGAQKQVCLTVQEHREGARRLYEALGFREELVLVGFEKKL